MALLTRALDFIEGNRAATELFGLDRPRAEIGGAPFNLCETVYAEKREGTLPAEFLRAAARSLKDKRGTSEIILRIKAPVGDPRPCTLKLERIDALERKEILLRAIPEEKDALADSFVEARERFDVESSLTAADRVCRRATAYLATYAGQEESRFLAGCVREVVVNAVEHGNLEIGFDEKSESMKAGRYFELLQERRTDPRFRSRKVVVEYSISPSRATFRVTDEGDGFDYRRFVQADGAPSAQLLEHGRGLFITMSAFDRVLFNEKGNQVTLVKYFAKEAAPSQRIAGGRVTEHFEWLGPAIFRIFHGEQRTFISRRFISAAYQDHSRFGSPEQVRPPAGQMAFRHRQGEDGREVRARGFAGIGPALSRRTADATRAASTRTRIRRSGRPSSPRPTASSSSRRNTTTPIRPRSKTPSTTCTTNGTTRPRPS